MAKAAPSGESEKRRERPAHWDHPVDEDRRLRRVRAQRRRRIALATIFLLLVGLFSAYSYLTSDKRVEKFAEAYLEDLLGTKVALSRASFSWTEGLVLENLRVMPSAPFKEPILSAQRVDLRITPQSLLLLSPEVTEIVVHRPTVNLVLWDEQKWNFQTIARTRPLTAVMPLIRPVVALEEGTLRIQRKIAGETVYEHQMLVSGLLLPSETDRDSFRFQTDVKSRSVHLAVSSGLIDARMGTLQFEGQASNVALAPDLYRTLPREAQLIWNRFEPTGSVNVKLLFNEKDGFRLVTDLTGVNLAREYSDVTFRIARRFVASPAVATEPACDDHGCIRVVTALPRIGLVMEYRALTYRFDNLTGRCTFSPKGLGLAEVQGLLNGLPIRLDGQVTGFDGDRLGMDLSIRAEQVGFEESRGMLTAMAPAAAAMYAQLSPKGPFDTAIEIHRAPGEGSPLEVAGTVACRDIEMTYREFPYRIERLHGTVRFTSRGFETQDMEGYHGQATVRLEGWAKNFGPRVESRILIHARQLALDDDLRAALAPAQQRIYDQYQPGGTADAEVEIYRRPVEGTWPDVSLRLTLLNGRFRYEGFPYGLTEAVGQVNILPDRTEIVNVRGQHGQARVVLSGEILGLAGPADPRAHLKVTALNVPLDEDLLGALPEKDRAVLRVFHLSGLADVEGTVTTGPGAKGGFEYDLGIQLKGGRMVYEPFPFLAEQVTGHLRLVKGTCRIDSITGYNSGAKIEARGWIDQRADDYAMDLVLVGSDVPLGESLRGALGSEIRQAWSHLAPRGRVDINAHLTKALGPREPVKHHVWVMARDAQATLDVFPYPLDHVTGQFEFQGSEVRLQDVKARAGPAEFGVTGRIIYNESGPDVSLAIKTQGLRLEGPLRDALPGPLQSAFDIIHPTGRLDLNLTRLEYHPLGEGKAEAVWSGSAILDEVGAEPGVKMAGLVGTAQLSGRWADGKVTLDGQVRIQQGKVADKEISNLRMLIEKPPESSTVSFRKVEGEFYDGRIEGFATIRLEPTTRYAFDLAATDVNFERLLRDGFHIEHNITGGKLRATLGLWAKGPTAQEVEASGYADITDAHLYELPMVVRILNAFRLSAEDRTAFDKARVLYFARNKDLYLGDIRLEGKAMSLFGAGTVNAANQLNLVFLMGKHNDDPLIPALSELGEGIRKELVVVLVTGTLAEPKVEVRSLSGLTGPLRELLRLVREQRTRDALRGGK